MTPTLRSTAITALALALAIPAAPALAVDGVIEINQAAADAGGITPGDGAGLPVTISEPGSYRLTGDLSTASASISGVAITAANVTLDLNGFGVYGPVTCSGTPVTSCSPSANSVGVSSTAENTAVRNGTVSGFGTGVGSSGFPVAHVESVRTSNNTNAGFIANNVVDSEASRNGDSGVFGDTVLRSTANGNKIHGITVGDYGLVESCRTEGNGADGITAGIGSVIRGNASNANGSDGIFTTQAAAVIGNSASRNTEFGLRLTGGGYAHNVLQFNNPPNSCLNDQVSGGSEMDGNYCCGPTCP